MPDFLIIEDEQPAAKRLWKLIQEIEPKATLCAVLESVTETIEWLSVNKTPDLIFSDIQLSDGISFEIFSSVTPDCPIIFITAFDQYAIDAFKLNSIGYLLKPVKKEELQAAVQKYQMLHRKEMLPDLKQLLESYNKQETAYKKRFVVKYGEHLKTINIDDIAYFNTEDKITFLTLKEGRRYVTDFNLDQLESMLDPKNFFRINRQFIISIHSIAEMFSYTKSRVLIKLQPASKIETIVSTERSASFKNWLGS